MQVKMCQAKKGKAQKDKTQARGQERGLVRLKS
jgi:hypothetical protein